MVNIRKKKTNWPGTSKKHLNISWIMPPPGKGSGGHINIYRFIKYLEEAGHKCTVYLYANGGGGSLAPIKLAMDGYPSVKAKMNWLDKNQNIPESDAIFATSWETAYASFLSTSKAKRFYFVQDFEPFFYPVGSLYALAENTYKLGFYGITAGGWLAKKLTEEYGMETTHYDFGADKSLYKLLNDSPRTEISIFFR